jgi:hypothetical protein
MPTVTGDNFYIDKHTLQFRTGTTSTASIEYSKVDDSISINTAGTGSINIGDAGGDIFIGDGSTQSDLVFEQNGAIRALANKTLTLGQSDSNVVIAAQNFTISGDSDISGEVNFQKVDVTGANSWAGRDNQHGAIYLSSEDRGLLGNMGGGYARPLIQGGSNAVTIGSNGTSAIRDVTVYAGNGAGAAMSNFNVFTSGSKRMTITRSGTMGFGGGLADNPSQAVVFDLQDSRMDVLNGAIKIRYAANNDAITLTPSVGNEARILASDGDTSSPHPLKIAADQIRFTTSGVSADTEVMRLTSEGNVGIGTNDPDVPLEVTMKSTELVNLGSSGPNATLQFGSSSSTIFGSIAARQTNTSQSALGFLAATPNSSTATYGDMFFSTRENDDSDFSTTAGKKAFSFVRYTSALMTIMRDGKVGIGTNIPSGTLHVNGSGLFEDNVMIGTDGVPTATKLNIADGHVRLSDGYKIDWGGTNVRIDGNNASDYFRIFTSGTEKLRVDQAGNVGIGNTTMGAKLDIRSAPNTNIIFTRSSTDGQLLHNFWVDSSDHAKLSMYANGQSQKIFLNTNGSSWFDGGNLAVGAQTATAKFLVDGESASRGIELRRSSIFGTGNVTMRMVGTSGSPAFGFNVSDVERMRITNGGDVGIGTDSPQEKLHVYNAGTARVEIESTTGPAAFKATNNQGSYGWYVNGNNDSFRLYDFGGGVDYITVSGNGNVAIGTDLAPQKFNVKGTIVHLNSSNIQVAGITNSSDAGRLYANNAGGVTKVLLDSNGDSYLNGGDVGIGTNAPVLPLHVEGSVLIDAYNQTSGSGQGIFFRQGFTASNKYNLSILTHNDGDTSPDALDINAYDGINFCVGSNTRNPKVSIKSDGDVGIGTVSPSKQVEIRAAEPYLRLEESDSGGNKRLDLFVSQSTGVIAANQSAQTMMFQTVGENRMTIASDGDVGIGTTDPSTSRLRIKGSTSDNSTNALQCIDSSSSQLFFVRNDGVVQVTDNYFYVSASAGAYVQTDLRVRGSLSNDGGPLAIGGAVNFTTTTGMVGIGTNSPRSGRLHIYNSNSVSDGDGSASMNPTGQDSIVLYTQGGANKNFGSISWLDGGRRRAMIAAASERADGDYQGLSFFTRGTDGPGDLYESMRINHGGTVGIGVTGAAGFHANAERLVVGDGAGSEGITIYAGSSNAASLYFADGTAGDAAYRGFVQYSHSAEKLFLGAGGGTQMTLTNTSLVGIGTQSPTYELDVAGTIRTTGGNVLVQKQDPQVIFTDQGGSTYDASWMYQNNAIKFVWGGGHKFKVDSAGGTTLGQSFSSNYTAPSKGIIMEGRLGVGTSGVGEASLYVADLTSETNGKAIISGTGTCTLASDLYVYGSGNGDVINAVRDRNDASIKVTSTTAGAYFRTNSATATYNGIDLNTNWFIGQYGYNDLRIVDGTASAGDAAAAVTVQNSTKRVGIGTTNPADTLQVAGQVRIDGSTTDGLTITSSAGASQGLLIYNNSNTDTANIINYYDGPLVLGQNNTEVMRIHDNSNVGIGTNAPTKKLEVQTDSEHEITTGLLIHNNVSTTGTAGKGVGITMGRANGTYSSKIANVWTNNNPSYLQTNIAFYTMHDSHLPGSETEKMRLTSKGYLGIGTGSPRGTLDVVGNTDNDTDFLTIHDIDPSAGSHRPSIRFRSDSAQIGQIVALDNSMRFSVGSSEDAYLEIESNGDVGIGTDAADNRLHVETSDNEVAKFQSTDPKGYIRIRDNNYISYIGINSTAGAASFGGQVDGAADTGNLNISTINGKVGIGTTSFSQQLGVKPDTDVAAEIGKAHVGYLGHADYAGFCHVDMDSANNYALLQSAGGHTYLNATSSHDIHFRINNSDIGGFNSNGDFFTDVDTLYVDASEDSVGINTNAPGEALDVVGFIRMGHATANSTQKIARQVVRAYNTSHNDFMAFMGTANQTSNVISYGGGSSNQTCATELAFFTHTDVSSSTAGTKRARINLSGNFSLGADEYLKTHNTSRAHIQAQGTSVDLNSSKIADATLLLGNEYGATNSSNPAYGLAIGVNTAGCSLLQSRRFNSSTFFEMALNPYGGNVGIGTDNPGYKLEVNGSIVGSSKSFIIDHPTQTGKKLMHACIEGPENGVYFRGRSQETGVEAPEYWSGLVDIDSMTVDVTPIGPNQSIYVDRIDDNGDICVGSNTAEPLNYFYVVYGERKDIDKLEIVKDPTPPASEAHLME